MKALLVSEGVHEQSGALQSLVKRLASSEIVFDLDRVSRSDIHAHHGKGRGYFKRALRWLLEARKRGCDALILVIDEDGRRERILEFDQAQNYEQIDVRRALGVAVRTFDAWMLADELALTKVLGCKVARQSNPEEILNPKQRCTALHQSSQNPATLREIYADLAMVVNIEVLEALCPIGFTPFASRVRVL